MTPVQPSLQDQSDASAPAWRRVVLRIARLQPGGNPSGLVYGMIVASVVITAEVHYEAPLHTILTATTLTVAVYWLTHVYCHLLGETMRGDAQRIRWARAKHTFRDEATVLWGGGIEMLAVAVAYVVGADSDQGDWIAIAVTIVLLFVWGLVAAVRNAAPTRVVLLEACLGASLGALVALLKLLLK